MVQELLTSNFFKSFIISEEKTTSSKDCPSVSLELERQILSIKRDKVIVIF